MSWLLGWLIASLILFTICLTWMTWDLLRVRREARLTRHVDQALRLTRDLGGDVRCLMHDQPMPVSDPAMHRRLWHNRPLGVEDRTDWGAR